MNRLQSDEERRRRAYQIFEEHCLGEMPPDGAVIEALLTEHSDCADELRSLFDALELQDRALASHRQHLERLDAELGVELRLLQSTSRYELRREIGRGGMGTVFEAYDRRFSRLLAYKSIRDVGAFGDVGDSDRALLLLRRFRREAEITGALDHPGVVPVHDLGVDDAGRPFYTMKLVQGPELRVLFDAHHRVRSGSRDRGSVAVEVAGSRRRWTDKDLVDVVLRICETMAFAHEHGIVHRDLKPQNVMVGDHGEVYVMDWGLARRLDEAPPPAAPSARGEAIGSAALTVEGSAIGTACYMPPEQARGAIDRIGPRSDVYSIGAMLRELLSGQAPYAESGREATVGEILERIKRGPPPPLDPRCAAPELIAVCERAMAYEPEDRFADAAELADQLRSFLDGRVVSAFATGPWQEVRKWVRRNRALAASMVVVLLAIVGGSAATFLQYLRAERNATLAGERADQNRRLAEEKSELARAESAARERAVAEAQRAAHRGDVAEQALEQLVHAVQNELSTISDPRTAKVRLALLRRARSGFEELREALAADEGALARAVKTTIEIARLSVNLADADRGASAGNQAVALAVQLVARKPEDYAANLALVHALMQAARAAQSANDPAAALALLQRVAGPLAQAVRLAVGDEQRQAECFRLGAWNLGSSGVSKALLLDPSGLDDAEAAVRSIEGWLTSDEPTSTDQHELGRILFCAGVAAAKLGEHERALPFLERATEVVRAALARAPERIELLDLMGAIEARTAVALLTAAMSRESLQQALKLLQDATSHFRDVLNIDPQHRTTTLKCVETMVLSAKGLLRGRRFDEARTILREAEDLVATAQAQGVECLAASLAVVAETRGQIEMVCRNPQQYREAYGNAIRYYRVALADGAGPEVQVCFARALVMSIQGDMSYEDSVACYEEAAAVYAALPNPDVEGPMWLYFDRSALHDRHGATDLAIADMRRFLELAERQQLKTPRDAYLRARMGEARSFLDRQR